MLNSHIQGFLITFLLSLLVVPLVRRFCIKKGYVDLPNKRKVHKKPTPRLGGVAIWICTLLGFAIVLIINTDYPYSNGLSGIFAGGSLLFFLGLIDDLYELTPNFKLLLQIVAASLAFFLGVRIEILSNPFGDPITLGLLSYPLTIIWLVGITNAINFIDGLDGLAGGVITIIAITLGLVAIASNQPASALIAILLAGSIMGFLVFNFYPAKIFMGDSGSLFSGFVLAGLSVTGVVKSIAVSVLLPVLIFTVPIIDMSFSVFRRLLKGNNPMNADKEHLHHKLMKYGFSQNRTISVLYGLCVLGGAIATFMVDAHWTYLVLIMFVVVFMFSFSRLAKFRRYRELKEARQK